MAVYENRDEIKQAFEDVKFGLEAAVERHRRRKASMQQGYQHNRYTGAGNFDDNDDDLYHTPNGSGPETENGNVRSNVTREGVEEVSSDDEDLWDSTRTLRAHDGQTSGIYDRKATFRSRRGGNTARRSTQSPPVYSFSSEADDPTTATSSTSSGEETPEDEIFNEKSVAKPLLNL